MSSKKKRTVKRGFIVEMEGTDTSGHYCLIAFSKEKEKEKEKDIQWAFFDSKKIDKVRYWNKYGQ